MKHKSLYLITFATLILFITLLGYYFNQHVHEKRKKEACSNLSILSQIKIRTIVNWRAERNSEAEFLFRSDYLKELVSGYLQSPTLKKLHNLEEFLKPFILKPDYSDAILITGIDDNLSFSSKKKKRLTEEEKYYSNEAFLNKEKILSTLHLDSNKKICMENIIPIIEKEKILCLLMLKIDPKKELFSLISAKPQLHTTLESFVVRRDHDSVIFLNDLAKMNMSGYFYKLPVTQKDLPAAMAVKGYSGIFEGIDYAGNKVLSHLDKIPASPWFIVSKINLDEVYAPIKTQLAFILIGMLSLMVICGLLIYIIWKDQKINYLNRQLILEKETRAVEEKLVISADRYSRMFNSNIIGLVVADFYGNIIEANDYFLKIVGYTREELNQNMVQWENMTPPEYAPLDKTALEELKCTGVCTPYEKEFIDKNGTRSWVLLADTIFPGKELYILATVIDITERKTAEAALNESQSRLLDAQALAHLGSWDLDLKKNVLSWTDEVYRIFGYKPQEFDATYETFLDSIHPEDRGAVNDAYLSSIQDGRDSYEIEHRIIRMNSGEVRFVHEKCKHIRDGSGKIIRSIGMVQDITERINAREALFSSEERFAKAFSANPNALVISQVGDGTILEVNDTFLEIFEYQKEEVIGKNAIELQMYVNPKDTETVKKLLLRSGHLRNFEVRLRSRTGIIITALLSIELLLMNGTRSMLTTIQDITERKKNELALRESEAQLLESQRLASLGSYTLYLKTETAEWSEETYRIFGIERKKKKLSMEEIFSLIHPADVDKLKATYEDLIQSAQITEYEFRIKTSDGIKYIYAYGKPVVNENGKVEQIFGTMMDISSRKQVQLKLEETLRELMRSNKDLEEFAYTASHDLQEPIRMIKSYAQLLEMKNNEYLETQSKQYLSFILDGASRMQQLVDDLLKYSRVTTTKNEFQRVDCNLVIRDVLKDLKFRIEDERAIIKLSELPVIIGDETQIRQLFQNFLNNALKFRSERIPEIKINCEKLKNQWLFSISDNGIGIDSMFYDRIFIIFQRLHERDKYPGTGIGLALCKKIVERHGGQVCVESELGKGTSFYFTIPIEGQV